MSAPTSQQPLSAADLLRLAMDGSRHHAAFSGLSIMLIGAQMMLAP